MQNVEAPTPAPYKKENIVQAFLSVELAAAVLCMAMYFWSLPNYESGATDTSTTSKENGPDVIERALELPPAVLASQGKYEEAITACNSLLAKKKHDLLANICVGNVFVAAGIKDDGLKYLKNAVALSHRNRYVIEDYAEKLAEAGQTSESIAQFEALSQQHPEWQKPHLELAKLYMTNDQPAEAAAQFKFVLDANDKNFAVRKLRAVCLARAGQNKPGLDEYVIATSQEAQSGIPQAIRSILGDAGTKAIDRVTYELNQQVQNKPDEYVPKLRLAQLYQYQNNPQAAKELLMDARRQAPNNPEIHRTLALVEKQLGEENQAMSAFALSVKLDSAALPVQKKDPQPQQQ